MNNMDTNRVVDLYAIGHRNTGSYRFVSQESSTCMCPRFTVFVLLPCTGDVFNFEDSCLWSTMESEHRTKRQRCGILQHDSEISASSSRFTTPTSQTIAGTSSEHKASSTGLDSVVPDARDLDILQPPDGGSRIVCYGMASQHYLNHCPKAIC